MMPILKDRQSDGVNSPRGGGLNSPRIGSPRVASPRLGSPRVGSPRVNSPRTGSNLGSPRDGNARKPRVPTRRNLRQSSSKISISTCTGQDGGAVSPVPSDAKSSPGPMEAPPDSANNVKVLIRMRPMNTREHNMVHDECSLQQRGARGLQLAVEDRNYSFDFDDVLGNSGSQEDIFQLVGQPMVSNVMQGYNACCLAYGQTGAGKTHTMQGELEPGPDGEPNALRGLAPRVFEQVFEAVKSKEGESAGAQLQYTCRCSFLQIYNEQVLDLLKPGDKPLNLRHDSTRGVFAEHLSEHVVVNVEDAMQLMLTGASNRAIGETKMNRQSSRSHSVFSMRVECRTTTDSGISHVRYGTLHLVDLAGSERVKQSGATGAALNEAADINVSLLTLGRVISKVVEAQQAKLGAHIPYRDSKLTFLLQDSLGGNAKTILIANVSPSAACAHETLSTLQFADGAKNIRNRARVNTDTQGDDRALRAEVERLQAELKAVQDGATEPLRQERDDLQARLEEASAALRDAEASIDCISKERDQLHYKLTRLDEKLTSKDQEYVELGARYTALSASSEVKLKEGQIAVQKAREELAAAQEQHEKAVADACAAREASLATARAERNSALNELKAKHAAESSGVENELRKRLEHAESRHAEALAEKEQLLLSAQAEAVSSTAAAQEKVSTELQKHNTEIARLEKEAEKRITDMKDKHRSELEASKRDFQKRIDAAKKESIQQLKRQTSNTVTADLQHKLDVQTAEACYYKMEVQAVKSQGEQLCKAIEEGQVHMQAQQQELEQLKSKHAEQLEKLESELTAVKREWERVSMLEADIKAQELSAAVRAATEATEQRMRDEESTKHKDLLSQIAQLQQELEQGRPELHRGLDGVKAGTQQEDLEWGGALEDAYGACGSEFVSATLDNFSESSHLLPQSHSRTSHSLNPSRKYSHLILALIACVMALGFAVNIGRQWGAQQRISSC